MPECCGSEGIFGRVAFDENATAVIGNFSVASPAYPLIQGGVTLAQKTAHVNAGQGGSNGRSAEDAEMTREGLKLVDGDVNLAMSPDSWDYFAWRALGGDWGAAVTGVTGVANTSYPVISGSDLPVYHNLTHKDARLYLYDSLVINQFEVSGQAGESIKMKLGHLGLQRVGLYDPALWPAALLTSVSVPYQFEDVTLLIDGVAFGMKAFSVVRSNNLTPHYYGKTNRTPCGFRRSGMAQTMIKLTLKHCADELAALFTAKRPPLFFDVKLMFAHPTVAYSARISMPGVQWPDDDPPVSGPGEIVLDLNGACRRAGGMPEINFYSDNA